jgi:hypothetical protein
VLVFVLRVLPPLALAAAGTILGMVVLAPYLPSVLTLPLLLVAVLAFVALFTFREVPGWSTALLTCFGLLAGLYLGSLFPQGGRLWGWAAVAAIGILALAALLGHAFRGRLRLAALLLWVLSWIYVAGWPLIALLPGAATLQFVWAAAGLGIFGCLGISWFAAVEERQAESSGSSLAIELYVIVLNLVVAGRVLAAGLAIT